MLGMRVTRMDRRGDPLIHPHRPRRPVSGSPPRLLRQSGQLPGAPCRPSRYWMPLQDHYHRHCDVPCCPFSGVQRLQSLSWRKWDPETPAWGLSSLSLTSLLEDRSGTHCHEGKVPIGAHSKWECHRPMDKKVLGGGGRVCAGIKLVKQCLMQTGTWNAAANWLLVLK